MPAIVEFPKVVQDAVRDFSDLFSCEPQRRLELLQKDSTTPKVGTRLPTIICSSTTSAPVANIIRWSFAASRNATSAKPRAKLLKTIPCCSVSWSTGYSLLTSQLKQGHAKDWALCRLTTIGEACRAMLGETLRTTLAWAIEQVTEKSRSYDHVVAKLGLT